MKRYLFFLIVILSTLTSCKISDTIVNSQSQVDPLSVGLSAYYPFSGNAKDQSGNKLDGIVYGAQLTSDRFGTPNSAYHFDGSTYISFGDVLDAVFCKNPAQFSVSGWLKADQSAPNGIVFAKSAGGPGPYQWSVTYNNNEITFGFISDSLAKNFIALYIHANINEWHHFAMVFDGTGASDQKLNVYVDTSSTIAHFNGAGRIGTSTQNTSLEMTAGGFKQTSQSIVENPFVGAVDDLRIYNRALSYNEIVALYNARN